MRVMTFLLDASITLLILGALVMAGVNLSAAVLFTLLGLLSFLLMILIAVRVITEKGDKR